MDKKILSEITRQRKLMTLNENLPSGFGDGILSGLEKAILKGLLDTSLGNTDDSETDIQLPSVSSPNLDFDYTNVPKSGKIRHKYTGESGKNLDLLIHELEQAGITNPYTQLGILSVAAKESGFKMQPEISYKNTSNSSIRNIFGRRAARYTDSELSQLKSDESKFFDAMYGKNSGMKLGNDEVGDGYKFRGRGFNQITGKENYRRIGSRIGQNLVANPDLLLNPQIAAQAAIAFVTKGKGVDSFPNFKTPEEAAIYFADINSGGSSVKARNKSLKVLSNFQLIS